jgi:hypothetical protein
MPEPIAIAAGVATLLRVAFHVGIELQKIRDDVNNIEPDLLLLIEEVLNLSSVLHTMNATFCQPELQASMRATGHIGAHWHNVAKSLADTERTLETLLEILKGTARKTEILNDVRILVRYNMSAERLDRFIRQVASCKATLQLSLETMI